MVAKLKDGGQQIDVMTRAQIDASRQRSKSKDKGPWVTDFEPMACKTIIRRNFKYLPVSVELQSAVAHDETSGGYVSAVQTGYIDIDPIPAASDAPEHDYYPEVDEDPQAPVADAQRAVCKQCGAALEVAPDALEDDLRNVACKQCGALGLSLSVEGV
jgi:recombination protein RecT